MKKLFCLLLVAFATTYTYAQTPEKIDKVLTELDKKLPPANAAMYLPYDYLKQYGFNDNRYNKGNRNKVYNTNLDGTREVDRINDIRWEFKDEKDAIAFYNDYGFALGEGGPVLKISPVEGVDEGLVFGISPGMKNMNKSLGLDITFYCYVFRIGNVVSKMFFTTKGGISVEAVQPFVKEAVKRVNAYVKGK